MRQDGGMLGVSFESSQRDIDALPAYVHVQLVLKEVLKNREEVPDLQGRVQILYRVYVNPFFDHYLF